MSSTFNIGGVQVDLVGLKKYYPFGFHTFNDPNLFDSGSYSERKFLNINGNHGWKLHADVKREMNLNEAAASMGLRPKRIPQSALSSEDKLGFEIFDQDKFDIFSKKFAKLTGKPLPGGYADDIGFHFLGSGNFYEASIARKYADPHKIMAVVANAGKHDIQYKVGHHYGPGRMFTFYGQSIEERDRIISLMEQKVGNYLEDQNDPNFLNTIENRISAKNTPISDKFSGRFTTDYLNVSYTDLSGKPITSIHSYSPQKKIDAISDKIEILDWADRADLEDRYVATGIFNSSNVDQQRRVLNNLVTDIPEMEELLHGAPGYVSPYKTIEDIMEYRVPGSSSVPLVGKRGKIIPQSASSNVVNAGVSTSSAAAPAASKPNILNGLMPNPPNVNVVKAGKPAIVTTAVKNQTNITGQISPTLIPTSGITTGNTTNVVATSGSNIITPNTATNVVTHGQGAMSATITSKPTLVTASATIDPGDIAQATASTARTMDNSLSKLVAGGVRESKNLRIAGAAVAALGASALLMRGKSNKEDHQRRLMMQRQGTYR